MLALQGYRGPSRLSKDVEADKQYVKLLLIPLIAILMIWYSDVLW